MDSYDYAGTEFTSEVGSVVSCFIGAGVWWFLSSQPSTLALILAAIFLGYLFLGYCLLVILLPGPDDPPKSEDFVPIPQAQFSRPKALTL